MVRALPLALTLLLAAAPAAAQGWIEQTRIRPTDVSSVQRLSTQIRVTLEGRIARVEVEELFRNNGAGLAEGSYLFPLPGEAVFTGYSLWQGDEELQGEMMPADQARSIYEEIVRRRRDPALLTLAGHGLIRARVFPIGPGETRKVRLRYTAVVERTGEALRFRYAFGPLAGRGPKPQVHLTLTAPAGDDLGTPFSPTHEINARRTASALRVTADAGAGGDLELFLPLRRNLVGATLLSHAPGGENGFFMLLLSPPAADDHAVLARDMVLVVDVSGSMSGAKLEQAKSALHQALGTLRPGDRFQVIAFSSAVRRFRPTLTAATPAQLTAAATFVDGLEAGGGTNIAGALEAALAEQTAREQSRRLSLVVFLTDGLPSIGERQPERLAASAASRVGDRRVFTVGLGHDVNTYLLDRLAREGRGSAEFVAPGADVEVAVGALVDKLRHPALVNLRIVSAPVALEELAPAQLPDLFYGEELVIFGRYRGVGRGAVVLEGERNGRRERFTATATFARRAEANGFIPPLWASRRIGELTRTARLEGGNPEVIAQIRDLGLRYGILTEYTSYLVQEPGDRTMAQRDQMLPATAPAEASGAVAFERAQNSAELRKTTSLAGVARRAEAAVPLGRTGARETRQVAGRLFVKRGGVWTDVRQTDSLQVVTIAPFSEAYFALVRALPELAEPFTLDHPLVVAGRRVSIRLDEGGQAAWRPGALDRVVADFRGL